jgi:hypothetical protein
MRHLFDHRNQQMMRCSRHALIIALLVLLLPMAVWAHKCGPSELTVGKGNIITYSIAGHDFVPNYEIVDKGDPLVAIIEPPVDVDNVHLVFKITGMGAGTTVFKIYWQGPRNHNTCPVKVTVSG